MMHCTIHIYIYIYTRTGLCTHISVIDGAEPRDESIGPYCSGCVGS